MTTEAQREIIRDYAKTIRGWISDDTNAVMVRPLESSENDCSFDFQAEDGTILQVSVIDIES